MSQVPGLSRPTLAFLDEQKEARGIVATLRAQSLYLSYPRNSGSSSETRLHKLPNHSMLLRIGCHLLDLWISDAHINRGQRKREYRNSPRPEFGHNQPLPKCRQIRSRLDLADDLPTTVPLLKCLHTGPAGPGNTAIIARQCNSHPPQRDPVLK